MKIVTHVVGSGSPVVAVVYHEERYLFLADVGLGEVGDYTDSILVKGEQGAGVGVGGIGTDYTVAFR